MISRLSLAAAVFAALATATPTFPPEVHHERLEPSRAAGGGAGCEALVLHFGGEGERGRGEDGENGGGEAEAADHGGAPGWRLRDAMERTLGARQGARQRPATNLSKAWMNCRQARRTCM